MAASFFPHSIPRPNRRSNPTVDLAAWHAALATANLRRATKAMGLLVIAHLVAGNEKRTTRRKLAADMRVPVRTIARHLRQLENAGLIQIVQHHHPKTGWHIDSSYRITLPLAAAATEAALPMQPVTTCIPQGAEIGTEAMVPKMAGHLAFHCSGPVDEALEDHKAIASEYVVGATRPTDVKAAKGTVVQPAN